MEIMTHLAFGGQWRQAFEFYENVLGRVSAMNTLGGNASCSQALQQWHPTCVRSTERC